MARMHSILFKPHGELIMFSKKKSTLGRSVETFESIIGESMRIEGDLIINKSLRVDGIVHGNILQSDGDSATVAIATSAVVTGNILVQDVIVSGELNGDISSRGRVEIVATAKVNGNVTYGSLGIAVGAHITGQLRQIDDTAASNAKEVIIKASKAKADS